MKKTKKNIQREVSLDGMMTFGQLENGLRTADFACFEEVEVEPFVGKCRVQMMRDGNLYLTAIPNKPRNSALFRDDNSSLSLGRNGRYYFVFSLDETMLEELPEKLISQASVIAQKVLRELICK